MTANWHAPAGEPAPRRDSSMVDLQDYFDGGSLALSWLAADGTILWANRAEYQDLGYAQDEFVGRRIHDFHAVPATADALLFRLAAGENVKHHEAILRRRDGALQHVTISGRARFDEQGRFMHAMCCTQECDAPEGLDARADRRSLTMLASVAEASDLFALSLDYERTLDNLTKLTIPTLGDLGFFDIKEGDAVRRITYVHERPEAEALLQQTIWIECGPASLVESALSTGHAHIEPDIDEAWCRRAATTPNDVALLRTLDLRSMVSVPLTYHGEIIGAMTLFFAWSGRRHGPSDLALAEELARRAAAALVSARLLKEAREAIDVRDDFLSLAGHELRTPLTALQLQILSISKLLGQPDALEKIEIRADKAARNVLRLSNLVNELLDISRISAGRLRLERSPVALVDAVRGVLDRQADELAKNGCAITLDATEPISGTWDRERIEQIVTNLVVNAMKYGKGKPIELMVARDDGVARLTVRDHGIGIPPDDQQRIFQRFERAVSSRHFGGLGLGLWIARQLVDAHGGTIRVSSEEDRGATFEVTLPITPREEVRT